MPASVGDCARSRQLREATTLQRGDHRVFQCRRRRTMGARTCCRIFRVRVKSVWLLARRSSQVAVACVLSPPSRRTPSRLQHSHSQINYSRWTLTKQPYAALYSYALISFSFNCMHFIRIARPTSRMTVNFAYSRFNLLEFCTACAKSFGRAVVIYSFFIIICCFSYVTRCIIDSAQSRLKVIAFGTACATSLCRLHIVSHLMCNRTRHLHCPCNIGRPPRNFAQYQLFHYRCFYRRVYDAFPSARVRPLRSLPCRGRVFIICYFLILY